MSDFTKYFFKDCQFKSGSVWFSIFQHYFFKRWWRTGNVHEYWNHRIQNIWGQKNWGKVSISQRKIKEKLSLKTSQDESVMNNSINTGISKYFVHLIMSKLCERTYFSNFRSFPTMKPKPFWSRHWIFLYPFNFRRYFLIFHFQYLVKLINFIQMRLQDSFDSTVFFAKNHAR